MKYTTADIACNHWILPSRVFGSAMGILWSDCALIIDGTCSRVKSETRISNIILAIIAIDERPYNKTTKFLFVLDQLKNSQVRITNIATASPKLTVVLMMRKKLM